MKTKTYKHKYFRTLSFLTIATLFVGTVFYHYIEKWNWIDSLYFSVITLTTIGFGDFVPTTPVSKVFTMIYIFIGIGIIFAFVNLIIRRVRK